LSVDVLTSLILKEANMPFSTLMYHEIRELSDFNPAHPSHIDVNQNYKDILPPVLFVTLDKFKEQMSYLYNNNYHTLTLEEVRRFYYDHIPLPEKSILLTFDDCYQSIKQYAYPILKEYGFHAVAFVVTNWLHKEAKEFTPDRSVCLTEQDLTTMMDVFEYANHTDSFHIRYDAVTSCLMTESDETFYEDLTKCNKKEIIQAKDVFAYPFGLYEERNTALLKSKGFKLAFTSEPGNDDKNSNPLLLKRNVVPYFIDLDNFVKIL
jgi:peptidoglycan/xylan/chitin deacetylase (PgdA/CDA1 family)